MFLRGAESETLNGVGSGGQKNGSDELGRIQDHWVGRGELRKFGYLFARELK